MLIPPSVLNVAKCAGSQDDSLVRPWIDAVRIERNGDGKPIARATDGKTFAEVQWIEDQASEYPHSRGMPDPGFRGISVPAETCLEAAKSAPKKSTRPVLGNVVLDESQNGNRVEFYTTDLTNERRTVGERNVACYPSFSSLLEVLYRDTEDAITIDPFRLRDALDAVIKIHGMKRTDQDAKVFIRVPKKGKKRAPVAILAGTGNGISTTAGVMPMEDR